MFRTSKSKLAHAIVVAGTVSLLLSSTALAWFHGAGGTASGWHDPVRLKRPLGAIVAKGTTYEFGQTPTGSSGTDGLRSNKPKGGSDGDFVAPPNQVDQVPDMIEFFGSGGCLEAMPTASPLLERPARAARPTTVAGCKASNSHKTYRSTARRRQSPRTTKITAATPNEPEASAPGAEGNAVGCDNAAAAASSEEYPA
jgi:hypothetical protein